MVNPILSRAMDRIFTLHADHEQNASTSTVRLASSSGANPFACIAAGIACLWGPAHGGANQAAWKCSRRSARPTSIPEFIARAKDKDDPFRLMGFGHRVYKNFDPRATVMKESADEVLELLGVENNPILQVAKELEKQALEDPYFAEKKLFPNVDFYSGIILEAMGFPTSMFTPIFAVGTDRRLDFAVFIWAKPIATTSTSKIGELRGLRYAGVLLPAGTRKATRQSDHRDPAHPKEKKPAQRSTGRHRPSRRRWDRRRNTEIVHQSYRV